MADSSFSKPTNSYTLPPWEHPRSTSSNLHHWRDALSRQPKRVLIPLLLAPLFILLALALGLSIGLTHPRGARSKPLPLGSEHYVGDLTYYDPGLGACGKVSKDGDDVVSVSHFVFDAVGRGRSDPNGNGLCGRKLRAVREGRSVDLVVVDRCVGCQPTSIDVPPATFAKLADPDFGRVDVTWAWLAPIPSIPPS